MISLSSDLGLIDDFCRMTAAFSGIEGFLDPREGYLLCRVAAEGPGLGAVVELGSYCGRSTAYLAAGAKGAHREKVVAVDHFRGSPEHQAGAEFASAVIASEGTTFSRFRANLERADLWDHVTPIQAESAEAAAHWSGPIRLLFIDANHAYEAVRGDFQAWERFIVAGGLAALHDVGNAPGVTRFFEETTAVGSGWRLAASAVSLRVLRKD